MLSMSLTLELLRARVHAGFLLHGSPKKFRVLEPRTAHSTDEDPACCQTGVYATEDVRIAAAMATLSVKDSALPEWNSYYHASEEGFRMGGENATLAPGWIHVVPATTFDEVISEHSRELVSRVAVKPVLVFPVNSRILSLLNVTLEFDHDPFA